MQDEPVRLIATDIDGTLLNSQGVIPPENVAAIRAAQQAGITVAIASGRFAENCYVLLQDYCLVCPIISINGGRTVDEHLHPFSEHFMDAAAAQAIQKALRELGNDYFIFGKQCICTANAANPHHSELSYGPKMIALGITYLHGQEEAEKCVQNGVYKFFVCDNLPLQPVTEALSHIPGIDLTTSGIHNIEVMPHGIDKATGVADLAARLNIPLSQVMTLGDQGNDIPMLQIAGYSVSMGNASAETTAAARYHTAGNNEGGWADAVMRLALHR